MTATVRGYPALVDEGGSVALRVLGTPAEAAAATRAGLRRLLLLTLPSPLPGVVGRLDNTTKLALADNPHGSVPLLLDDCLAAALDDLVRRHGGTPHDAAGFARLRDDVRRRAAGHALRRGVPRWPGSCGWRTR